MEELLAAVALQGLGPAKGSTTSVGVKLEYELGFGDRRRQRGGGKKHVRRAPLLARIAEAQIVGQVRHDLPLGHNVFVAVDEHLPDV